MMRTEVVVLAEDIAQDRFARRYLGQLGYKRIYTSISPHGSAEQFVRTNYARQVQASRHNKSGRPSALLVLIDADSYSVEHRQTQLADALKDSQMAKRGVDERIAHFIPKRHIETWVVCLNGETVSQDASYENHRLKGHAKEAAEAFHQWTRKNATPPAACAESLLAAIPEAKRLER